MSMMPVDLPLVIRSGVAGEVVFTNVPEPAPVWLAGAGTMALALWGLRRRRTKQCVWQRVL
jgi:hypothetical protein